MVRKTSKPELSFWHNIGSCLWSDESQGNRMSFLVMLQSSVFENVVRNIINA